MSSPTATPSVQPLAADREARLLELARACRIATRAVSMYPPGHAGVTSAIDRLVGVVGEATAMGSVALTVVPGSLLMDGASPTRQDAGLAALSDVLRNHCIGGLILHTGSDVQSWRTLLHLLARAPEEIRANGGIRHLWAASGSASIELREIDYAEVLREHPTSDSARLSVLVAHYMEGGTTLVLDTAALDVLLELSGDSTRLAEWRDMVPRVTGERSSTQAGGFLRVVRRLVAHTVEHRPDQVDEVLDNLAAAAGGLSADTILRLLEYAGRPEGRVVVAEADGTRDIDVVQQLVDRMSDEVVAEFIATAVGAGGGRDASLAAAFQQLVTEPERRTRVLECARRLGAASETPVEEAPEPWDHVASRLSARFDTTTQSGAYASEIAAVRQRALSVEDFRHDPPERMAAWLASISDAALRAHDMALLVDLMDIEQDPVRARDLVTLVCRHVEDLARVGHFEGVAHLVEAVAEHASETTPVTTRASFADGVSKLTAGPLVALAVALARGTDEDVRLLGRVCQALGKDVIPALAEAIGLEPDARVRRRLQELVIAFGTAGREVVQRLVNSASWEVRQTAVYLLRELPGHAGLPDLEPLLRDSEPRVRREAIRTIVLAGQFEAHDRLTRLLFEAPQIATTFLDELPGLRHEQAAPFFHHLVACCRERGAPLSLYVPAIETLGALGGAEAVDVLARALTDGEWWRPLQTRAVRDAAARALARVKHPRAIEVLRQAAQRGSGGVRRIARRQLGGTTASR